MKIIGSGGHALVVRELNKALPVQWNDSWIIVAVGDNASRKREVEALENSKFPILIHPKAWASPSATIGEGTVIMAGAVVQAEALIGKHVIVNTGATVDHDAIVGDYAHIAPGAHLCGNVHVGEGALVGVGVGVAPNTKIPAWSLVKAARLDIEPV